MLRHHLGVLRFSYDINYLKLVQTHRFRAQSHKTVSWLQMPITSPRYSPILLTNWLGIRGYHKPLLRLDHVL